jgi:hypothetical protein
VGGVTLEVVEDVSASSPGGGQMSSVSRESAKAALGNRAKAIAPAATGAILRRSDRFGWELAVKVAS